MAKEYVAYLRVSTERQGRSGLGVEAQQRAIVSFINGNAVVLEWFKEYESGRKNTNERPQLKAALDLCEVTGASLVVSTLDRLTRDVSFLEQVKRRCERGGFQFCCADMPEASPFMLGIMAQVAQYEAERISERTKVALQSARERGIKLGGPNGVAPLIPHRLAGSLKGGAASKERADEQAELRRDLIQGLIDAGLSNGAIAAALNERGIKTTSKRGGKWQATTVIRLRKRLGLP